MKENTISYGISYNELREKTFKDQFCKHCNSLMQESKSNSKTYSKDSSKHFWEIKGKGNKNPIFNWLVIVHVKPLQKGQKDASYTRHYSGWAFWTSFLDEGRFTLTSDCEKLESRNFLNICTIVYAFQIYKKNFANINFFFNMLSNIDTVMKFSSS